MQCIVEVEQHRPAQALATGGADVAAFLSFVAMRGFGAVHPLIALADRLHQHHKIRLGPFTTFYDADTEDSEDTERLELAWQPAGLLTETVTRTLGALDSDPVCQSLIDRADTPNLAGGLNDLRSVLEGLDPDARVRLTYTL